ncbi:MAG TPA: hypothetical protein ENK54_03095 [Thiotrichales bacterium]|nr:hypothetical protein [Thiotrichales bacterium]
MRLRHAFATLLAASLLATPMAAMAAINLGDTIGWFFGGYHKRFYNITNYDFDGNKVTERRWVGKMTPLQLQLLRGIVQSEPPFESRILDLEYWTATGVYEVRNRMDKKSLKTSLKGDRAGELHGRLELKHRIRLDDGDSWISYRARIYDLETGVDISECRAKHVETGHCQEVHNLFAPASDEEVEFFSGLYNQALNPHSEELWRFTPFDEGVKAVWPRWIVDHPDGYKMDVRGLASTIWMNAEWLKTNRPVYVQIQNRFLDPKGYRLRVVEKTRGRNKTIQEPIRPLFLIDASGRYVLVSTAYFERTHKDRRKKIKKPRKVSNNPFEIPTSE